MRCRIVGIVVSVVTVTVAGCATVEERIAESRHLTCAELDQRIGKYKHLNKQAKVDGVVSDIVGIVGDKKEREEAQIESIGSNITKDDSDKELEALRRLKREKDCDY